MNKQIFKGQWRQIKAKLQDQWSELTDDDLMKIKANNQEIIGILEERYGYAKAEAQEVLDEFLDKLSMPDLSALKAYSVRGARMLTDAIKENPVKSFFIALSAIAFIRKVTKSTSH